MAETKVVKLNDQVTHRHPIRGGNLIKTGKVVSIQGASALVAFHGEPVKRKVPLASLEPIGRRYAGRASVHPNPSMRNRRG